MDYFEADVARSQMFTSDVIKARNVHKFSHGAAFYTLNRKNVNAMLESCIYVAMLCLFDRLWFHCAVDQLWSVIYGALSKQIFQRQNIMRPVTDELGNCRIRCLADFTVMSILAIGG